MRGAAAAGAPLHVRCRPRLSRCRQGTNSKGKVLKFDSPLYLDRAEGRPYLFGPTLRVKAGDSITIHLRNCLPLATKPPNITGTGFKRTPGRGLPVVSVCMCFVGGRGGRRFGVQLPCNTPPTPAAALPRRADPTHTNLHTHGLHEAPGIAAQTVPPIYNGGDNVFIQVPPKTGKLDWYSHLPEDHLPGLHWCGNVRACCMRP